VDFELFTLLGQRDRARAMELIERVCRTFDDYEFSAEALEGARRELLEALD
jgi:hypothetical protein